MTVLFASGDVGGARALLPVIRYCKKSHLPFAVLQHGFIAQECPPGWPGISCPEKLTESSALALLQENDIQVLVFASSVKDTTALQVARAAQEGLNLPVIHVLDNWSNYRRRLETDGLPPFAPDYYTVMDEKAYAAAARDGVTESSLVVTGHTIWSDLPFFRKSAGKQNRRSARQRLGFDPDKAMIVFISEPAEKDQGDSAESHNYRGYTEKQVLRLFLSSIQPAADRLQIGVLPHPREKRMALEHLWQQCRGNLPGGMLLLPEGRDSLHLADGVAGMASILLYEAWLLGLPVLSLQPGLRLPGLSSLKEREGVTFIDSPGPSGEQILKWAVAAGKARRLTPRSEVQLHRQGPQRIFELILHCLEKSAVPPRLRKIS